MFGNFNASHYEENKASDGRKHQKKRFFETCFLNYGNIEKAYTTSAVYRIFSIIKNKISSIFRVKQKAAEATENSVVCRLFSNLPSILLSCSLRNYGVFAFFYGIFNLAVNLICILNRGYNSYFDSLKILFSSLIVIILSGLLSFSHKSLGTSLSNSRIMSVILFDIFNVDIKKIDYNNKSYNNLIFILTGTITGIVFGILPQKYFLLFVLFVILFTAVVSKPEFGIILTFLFLPFAGESLLLFLVGLCVFSVFLKVIRNKRVLKIGFVDCIVLLLCSVVLISGFNGIGGCSGVVSSLRIVLIISFGWIMNNIIRTTVYAERCINSLVVSVTVLSAIGILIFFFDTYNLDSKALSLDIIGGYLRSVPFSKDKAYTALAVLVLPFTYSLQRKNKIYGWIASAICIIFSVLSMDFSVWMSLIFVSILYICIVKPGMFLYFAIVIALLFGINYFVPDIFLSLSEITVHLTNKNNLFSTITASNSFGINAVSEFLFSGGGSGGEVVSHIFSCLFGSDTLSLSQNTTMSVRILINYGFVGLILLLFIFLMSVSNCLSLFYRDKFCKASLKFYVVSCLASVSLIVFKSLFFASPITSNVLLCACLLFYLSFSIRKCSLIEFAPEAYDEMNYYDII